MPRESVQAKSRPCVVLDVIFGGLVALLPPWVLGQIARDYTWPTGLCFYIPSVFLAVVLLGCVVAYLASRRWRAARIAVCLLLPPLSVVLFVESHVFTNRVATEPGPLRLVHGVLDSPGARDELLAQRADLYVLSEVNDTRSVEVFREALGTNYESRVFANLAVIGAGSVQADGWLLERDRAKIQSVTWQQGESRAALFVVDLPSGVHVARDPLLREVNELIERHRPDLVVGDFNAPRRSRALSSLPAGYKHAFDRVGSGFGYTWPVPVPMYALDHCIYSPRIVPTRYDLFSSRYSDHRLQVLDFSDSPGER
jgi:vancomycin resistance protein VanJ